VSVDDIWTDQCMNASTLLSSQSSVSSFLICPLCVHLDQQDGMKIFL